MPFLKKSPGLTLAEVLISVFILSAGIAGVMLFFTHTMTSVEFAGDVVSAAAHAQSVLEEMQSRDSLLEITSTDWNQWAQKEGLPTLPNEKIDIALANTLINPLDVQVTVHWNRRTRPLNISLNAKIAK